MKRTCVVIALIMAAVLLFSSAVTAAPASWPDPDTEKVIDGMVQQVMDESHIPGIAVGLVDGDKFVYLKGFGEASAGRPVTPQTPFIIGSMSKSFTAMAAMQLVEAGKLVLDAPVQRYLPWFRVVDEAASAKITVRHLLTHTSGLPRSYDPKLMVLDDRASVESVVRGLANVKLSGVPGERFEYCNLNYITVSLIVESLSGVPFDQYISQRIMAPLGMQHSYTAEQPAMVDGMAMGHIYVGGMLPVARRARYSRARLAEGFVISSAEDMSRYLLALIHGGTYGGTAVLGPESVKALTTPAVPMFATQREHAYGMGWEIFPAGSEVAWEHGGETTTFKSAMVILPDRSRGLVILSNANADPTGGVQRLENALIKVMGDQLGLLEPGRIATTSYLWMAPFVLLLLSLADLISLPWWRRRVRVRGARLSDWVLVGLSLVVAVICFVGVPIVTQSSFLVAWIVAPIDTSAALGAGALALFAICYRCPALWKRRT